jgi:hypothetical protein
MVPHANPRSNSSLREIDIAECLLRSTTSSVVNS